MKPRAPWLKHRQDPGADRSFLCMAGSCVALTFMIVALHWQHRRSAHRRLARLRRQVDAIEQQNAQHAQALLQLALEAACTPPAQGAAVAAGVQVISVETRLPGDFMMLGVAGRPVLNVGAGMAWTSWMLKPQLFRRHLGALALQHPDKLVILADGMDVINGGCSEEQMLGTYRAIVGASGGAAVVFGAEHCCFPWHRSCKQYQSFTARRSAVLGAFGMNASYEMFADCRRCRDFNNPSLDAFCSNPPAYAHLNSGFLMGPAASVLTVVALWLAKYSVKTDTDQFHARNALFERPDLVTLDYVGGLVLNIGDFAEAALGDVLEFKAGRMFNRVTRQPQCFVHGSGRGKGFVLQLLGHLAPH